MPLRRYPQLESWDCIRRNGRCVAFTSEMDALKCAFEHAMIFWADVERASRLLTVHSYRLSTSREPVTKCGNPSLDAICNPGCMDLAMRATICELEVLVQYLGEALRYLFSPPPENERVVIDFDRLVIVDDQADEPALRRAGRGPSTAIGGAP